MEFWLEYALFAAKAATVLVAIVITVLVVAAAARGERSAVVGRLKVKKVNERYKHMTRALNEVMLTRHELRRALKQERKREREEKKRSKGREAQTRRRLFVLSFDGDMRASAVASLREEVTALLTVLTERDEVLLRLQSGGGLVHSYGLAASQLVRIRDNNIRLTVAVDKVAASGGYMMACVGHQILAAPFVVLGSIGVVAQLPNFNRLLKRHHIDFEELTAGKHKRTLTLFGENTNERRERFQAELEDVHVLFKEFVTRYRPSVSIEQVSTGEHWYGTRAQQLGLVDGLRTSDDYLLAASREADLYEVSYKPTTAWSERLGHAARQVLERVLGSERDAG